MIILGFLLIIAGCVLLNRANRKTANEEYHSACLIWGAGLSILGIILCILEL